MTEILFNLKADSLEGLEDIDGVLRMSPSTLRFEGPVAVAPQAFDVGIVAGDLVEPVVISPADVTQFVWRFNLQSHTTGGSWFWFFAVPDVESIELVDLVSSYQVNPVTLEQEVIGPAWTFALQALQAQVEAGTTPEQLEAAVAAVVDDIPSLTLIFENGLI